MSKSYVLNETDNLTNLTKLGAKSNTSTRSSRNKQRPFKTFSPNIKSNFTSNWMKLNVLRQTVLRILSEVTLYVKSLRKIP